MEDGYSVEDGLLCLQVTLTGKPEIRVRDGDLDVLDLRGNSVAAAIGLFSGVWMSE